MARIRADVTVVVIAAAIGSACGVEVVGRDGVDGDRIVGGDSIDITEVPWQVKIDGCGGSIIGERWVLTAEHCVDDDDPEDVWVRAGITDKNDDEDGQYSGVSEIVLHEDADAALLKLLDPLDFSGPRVRPIRVASPEDDELYASPGTMALVSGWGRTSQGGSSPKNLRAAWVPIVDEDTAEDAYDDYDHDLEIAAGFDEGGVDSCQGDSGGPLVVEGDGQMLLVGVVSRGKGCAREGYPGVYARTSALDGWIESTTGIEVGSGDDPGGPPYVNPDYEDEDDKDQDSCSARCGDYHKSWSCQCDDVCSLPKYDDCCSDLDEVCS